MKETMNSPSAIDYHNSLRTQLGALDTISDTLEKFKFFRNCDPVDISGELWTLHRGLIKENKLFQTVKHEQNITRMKAHNKQLESILDTCKQIEDYSDYLEYSNSNEYLQQLYGEYLYYPDWQESFNWAPVEEYLDRDLSEAEKDHLRENLDYWVSEKTYTNYWAGEECLNSISYGEIEEQLDEPINEIADLLKDLFKELNVETDTKEKHIALCIFAELAEWHIDTDQSPDCNYYAYSDMSDSGVALYLDSTNLDELLENKDTPLICHLNYWNSPS